MQSTTSFHQFKDVVKKNYSEKEGDDGTWMLSVKATLGILGDRPWDLSIYKVPNKLRRLKQDAYNPQIVSIGPLHVREDELLGMEEHKWRYMLNFLRRANDQIDEHSDDHYSSANDDDTIVTKNQGSQHLSERAIDDCGKAILELEKVSRACYAENISLNKHQLVEILLVDGCFILELFIKHADQDEDEDEEEDDTKQSYTEVDPIINNSWMVPTLQHDLALLENQIPFVVLQTLFNTMQKLCNKQFRFSLKEYVLLFFRPALNLSDEATDDMFKSLKSKRKANCEHKHLADFLHCVVYKPTIIPNAKKIFKASENIEWGFKKCATQLVKSGIKFQPGGGKNRQLDITFEKGVITIPPLDIQETTDSVFRNLIALEQCSFGHSHHMASYALLMKSLIRSSQDVEYLREKGIIITSLGGGDEEVLTFFRSLCREVVFKDFYFDDLCEKVNKYNKTWLQWDRIKAEAMIRSNEYIVSLQNDYFNNPWTIISFFAASLLLCLTVLQTFYSVRSYYPR